MSIFRTVVLTIATVAVVAAPAGATLHSPTDSYMTEPCKLDTSPSYPSCGSAEAVAIKLGATSFTVTPPDVVRVRTRSSSAASAPK